MRLSIRQFRREVPPHITNERLHQAFLGACADPVSDRSPFVGAVKWDRFEWRKSSTEGNDALLGVVASAVIQERDGQRMLEGEVSASALFLYAPSTIGIILGILQGPKALGNALNGTIGDITVASGFFVGILILLLSPIYARHACTPFICFLDGVLEDAEKRQPAGTDNSGATSHRI